MSLATVIVLAKAPLAGHAKTRLCPPLTPAQASSLAEASLRDTLDAASRVPGARPLLVLDGPAGAWLPPGLDVVPQRGRGLGERLAGAFAAAGGPALAIGMDTPQLTAETLRRAVEALRAPGTDAVLGPALDGGYWGIGLRRPDERVFADVPMSSPRTGAAQRARLRELGLRVAGLGRLRDVDTIEDAIAVASESPGTRFAATLAEIQLRTAGGVA